MKRGAPRHPKMGRLMRALGIPRYAASGIMELLWHTTAQYYPNGDLTRLRPEEVAEALEWGGDSTALLDSLVESGWLDRTQNGRLLVHDWHVHADDTVNVYLARKGERFANGAIPKMTRLSKKERESLQARYAQVDTGPVRTETSTRPGLDADGGAGTETLEEVDEGEPCARHAHNVRTANAVAVAVAGCRCPESSEEWGGAEARTGAREEPDQLLESTGHPGPAGPCPTPPRPGPSGSHAKVGSSSSRSGGKTTPSRPGPSGSHAEARSRPSKGCRSPAPPRPDRAAPDGAPGPDSPCPGAACAAAPPHLDDFETGEDGNGRKAHEDEPLSPEGCDDPGKPSAKGGRPRDPCHPPGGFEPTDWQRACRLADELEAAPIEALVRGRGGEIRAKALAYSAEHFDGKGRGDGWAFVEGTVREMIRYAPAEERLRQLLSELLFYPDGAYPGNGNRPHTGGGRESSPCRLEQAARILRERSGVVHLGYRMARPGACADSGGSPGLQKADFQAALHRTASGRGRGRRNA